MTAPTTFVVKGTFLEPDGSTPAVGTVTFQPVDNRFINTGNVIESKAVTFTLDGAGKLNGTTGYTLVQATNGYTVTTNFTGHMPRQFHMAATGNIDISESRLSMHVTGTFYGADDALAAGSIVLTDTDTNDVYNVDLVSGVLSVHVFKNTDGYTVVQGLTGQMGNPSYTIPGNADIDLSTV